jgi:peptide/nickel transport system ATP-binding protein
MYAGKPVETGSVEDIYYKPRMPYTLGLLGSLPRLDSSRGERLTPIQGAPPSLLNLPPGCPFTPRCPMAQPMCAEREPDLEPVAGAHHSAACHFSAQLENKHADEVFAVSAEDSHIPTEFGADTPGPADSIAGLELA